MKFTYESNPRKAARNIREHHVSFDEAVTVFEGDPSAYTDFDSDHSETDLRFFTIGTSSRGRLLYIVHNEEDGIVRFISARLAEAAERKLYEEVEG